MLKTTLLGLTGFTVGGFGSAIRAAMLPPETTGLTEFFTALAPWLTSFTVTSAAMQTISSLLIAWKVWAVVSRDTDSKPRSCSFVSAEYASLRIGIESGVLRTLCAITLVPFAWGDSMGTVIVAAVACQIDVSARFHRRLRSSCSMPGYGVLSHHNPDGVSAYRKHAETHDRLAL